RRRGRRRHARRVDQADRRAADRQGREQGQGIPPAAPTAAGMNAPRYGEASLADVGPSLLAALGVAGEPNALGVANVARACLFVVDGLGWEQLQASEDA